MGEYWKPVNLTRLEYIHPHHLGCGLKWHEWNHEASAVRRVMAERWPSADVVVAISDRHRARWLSERVGSGALPEYDDIAEHFAEIGTDDPAWEPDEDA